jgi:hypothetical protein
MNNIRGKNANVILVAVANLVFLTFSRQRLIENELTIINFLDKKIINPLNNHKYNPLKVNIILSSHDKYRVFHCTKKSI